MRSCGLSLLGAVIYHHQGLIFIIIRGCDLLLSGAVVIIIGTFSSSLYGAVVNYYYRLWLIIIRGFALSI